MDLPSFLSSVPYLFRTNRMQNYCKLMKREQKKICLIASAGGHLEQIRQLKDVIAKYDTYYVVPKVKSTEKAEETSTPERTLIQ